MNSSTTLFTARVRHSIVMLCALAGLAACAGNNNQNGDGAGDGAGDGTGTGDGAASDGGDLDVAFVDDFQGIDAPTADGRIVVREGGVVVTEDGGMRTCFEITCDNHLLQCGDCVDNDGDGRIDDRDPECLGPCDNTEGPVLLAGVGGETGGPCQSDCYFDFGNGPGNDDCQWSHRCDPLAVAPNYPPEGMRCAYDMRMVGGRDCPVPQSRRCLDYCGPLTPNGCDCFGCCTFPGLAGRGPGGGPGYVWLGSRDDAGNGTCTIRDVTNPALCHVCTPVPSCLNSCEPCEICIGRPLPDPVLCRPSDAGFPDVAPLPDGARPDIVVPDGGTTGRCAPGVQVCGLPGEPACPFGSYCITGCCIAGPG